MALDGPKVRFTRVANSNLVDSRREWLWYAHEQATRSVKPPNVTKAGAGLAPAAVGRTMLVIARETGTICRTGRRKASRAAPLAPHEIIRHTETGNATLSPRHNSHF